MSSIALDAPKMAGQFVGSTLGWLDLLTPRVIVVALLAVAAAAAALTRPTPGVRPIFRILTILCVVASILAALAACSTCNTRPWARRGWTACRGAISSRSRPSSR